MTARRPQTWLKLQRPINMDIPLETPLDDVRACIKKQTVDNDSGGLPTYLVDENGLIVIASDSSDAGVDDLRALSTLDTLTAVRSKIDELGRNSALLRRPAGTFVLPRSEFVPTVQRSER